MAIIKYYNKDNGQWEPLTGGAGARGDKGNQGDIGPQGPSGTLSVGTVTTGAAGSSASVVNIGTSTSAIFNFTIPRGDTGAKGDKGDKGDIGDVGPAGPVGPNGAVSIGDTMPVDNAINMWIDPDDNFGDTGWTALDGRFVNATGDTMTGPLGVENYIAVTETGKGSIQLLPQPGNEASLRIQDWGGNSTGLIANSVYLEGTPSHDNHAINKGYVDTRFTNVDTQFTNFVAKATVSSTAPASPVTGQLWCPI